MFTIAARSPGSRARRGTLHLAHGDVQTPAFVPLATRGAVKTLEPRDVAALGYEMVLGNTFHLFLAPGHELVAEMGGLHEFMRWDGPIITDSGGFQVFSMGYGSVADEIKGRRGQPGGGSGGDSNGTILAIEEEGVRFRSYLDGGERFMGPETSMTVQAALGSDIALVFDECTPFHVTRDYTARSMERTHRWLARCLDWHERHGPAGQVVYGIVQGGVEHDLRMALRRRGRRQPLRRNRHRRLAGPGQGADARGGGLDDGRAGARRPRPAPPPARHRRDRRPHRRRAPGDRHLRLRHADAAGPPRGCARAGSRAAAGAWTWSRAAGARSREPILEGCPCPACSAGFSRGYLHYLLRAHELTGLRLVTLHNLSFMARADGRPARRDRGRPVRRGGRRAAGRRDPGRPGVLG